MRRLLSLLMFLTVFLSLLMPCAVAEDTLTWNLVSDTLYISGKGEMHDFSSDVAPWRKYKDQITAVYVEEGVKSVPGVTGCTLNLTFEPVWDRSMLSEEARVDLGLDYEEDDYGKLDD